jgi:hypothetical protein
MSMVLMSKRELNRLDVLARLDTNKLTVAAAAELVNGRRLRTQKYQIDPGTGEPSASSLQRGTPSWSERSDGYNKAEMSRSVQSRDVVGRLSWEGSRSRPDFAQC